MLLPFLAGALFPVLCFLVPYALSHSLGTFFTHVFGSIPGRVNALGVLRPASPRFLLWTAIPLLLLALAACWKPTRLSSIVLSVWALLAVVLADPGQTTGAYLWPSTCLMTPLVVLAGSALLLFRPSLADALTPMRQQQLFLILALAAMCSLIQFPLPAPIYFCYTAPMTALAIFALFASRRQLASPAILAAVLVFYLLYGIVRVQPAQIYAHWYFGPHHAVNALDLPRAGGLRIESAKTYEALTRLIQQNSHGGQMIATPECPEAYFLSAVRNPTSDDGTLSTDALLRTMQFDSVHVVVLNLGSLFSLSTLTPEVYRELGTRFPHAARIDRYLVYWR
jgi:hypothetical protein